MTTTWEELFLFEMPGLPTPPDTPWTVQARDIFEMWRTTYQPKAQYSDVRERRIIKGLKEFGYDACRTAILGMQYSEWHMGRNRTGQKFTEIRVALRNEDSILRFTELYEDNQGDGDW